MVLIVFFSVFVFIYVSISIILFVVFVVIVGMSLFVLNCGVRMEFFLIVFVRFVVGVVMGKGVFLSVWGIL